MRWLLVSAQHHPTHGGIGTYVQRFARAASNAGWHVGLVTRPTHLIPESVEAFPVSTPDADAAFERRIEGLRRIERIRPYRYGLWSLAVAERLLSIDGAWDAVEFVDSQAEGYVALTSARVRARWSGTPMVMHCHTPMWIDERVSGADPTRFGRSIYHAWERAAVRAADGVLCTSSVLARELPSRRPAWVLPYPVDLAPSPPPRRRRNGEILLVGAVQPRKGVDLWAHSLNRLLRERPATRAVLIGPDTPTAPDGTSMVAFSRSLLDADLRDRLEWTGPLPHEQVTARMAAASLVVVPSRYESFSFAAVEALSLGTPVLVAEGVGIAEHVPGIPVVRIDDPEELAAAQRRVLDDEALALDEAARLRESLRTRCSGEEHLRRRLAFLRSIGHIGPLDHTGADTLDSVADFLADVESLESRSSVLS